MAAAVNTLAAALSHSEARQREFLLSVSHELRTPLTAITGYAESLADGVVPPEQAAEVGAVLLTESHRLDRLVADLLDLARLDAQEFRVELLDVDARAAVPGRRPGVVARRCAAVGVRFGASRPTGPAGGPDGSGAAAPGARRAAGERAAGDAGRRPDRAGHPARTGPDGRPWAVAEVRDGGPGLSEDDLAVAFQRSALYERYRGVRQVGTGLGLAIVAGLVGRLGGTVEAGHAPEGGARFTVRLPAG